ncbi:hypothetical protein BaRGS_00039845, partial [Batillaria attramentaria]
MSTYNMSSSAYQCNDGYAVESSSSDITSTFDYADGGSESYARVLGPTRTHQQNWRPPRRPNNSPSSERQTPEQRSLIARNQQEKFQQLTETNKKLSCVFYILVAFCVLLLVVYVGVVVLIFAAHSKLEDSNRRSTGAASGVGEQYGGSRSRYPFCVREDDLDDNMGDVIKRMERENNPKTGEVCFKDLKWVPELILRVNSSVQDRATGVEQKHKRMQADLEKVNRTHRDAPNGTLKWNKAGMDSSGCRGLRFNMTSGELIIRESGHYFVYSQVTFKKNTRNTVIHRVVKNYRDWSKENNHRNLLTSNQGSSSFLQGVFPLIVNDTLAVQVTNVSELWTDSGRFTYFGAYLLRTGVEPAALPGIAPTEQLARKYL